MTPVPPRSRHDRAASRRFSASTALAVWQALAVALAVFAIAARGVSLPQHVFAPHAEIARARAHSIVASLRPAEHSSLERLADGGAGDRHDAAAPPVALFRGDPGFQVAASVVARELEWLLGIRVHADLAALIPAVARGPPPQRRL